MYLKRSLQKKGDNGATRIRCREEDPDPYDGHRKVTHFFGSLRLAPLTTSLWYLLVQLHTCLCVLQKSVFVGFLLAC